MTSKTKVGYGLQECPISNSMDDHLNIEPRFVDKIFDVINDQSMSKMTIAITGEWGSGKSSAMNLLRNKMNADKNRVINFEPLSEAQFEIADIIKLFYLKLYKELPEKAIKEIIKKCLKSMALLSGQMIGVDVVPILDLWEEEKPKDFSEQAKELNDILKAHHYKLYIFIDEIDRLPANYIINFLLFCRIVESFEGMVCIVGIDYEQAINKLMKERSLGLEDYALATSYVDKLFQVKYHVHHSLLQKIEFTRSILSQMELDDFIDLNQEDGYTGIIDYLSTPRQIKKWTIAIKLNYAIIKTLGVHKMDFLAFIAATIKHPIFTDYLSKYAMTFLFHKKHGLACFIQDHYGINFKEMEDDNKIIAASMGSKSKEGNHMLEKFMKILSVQEVDDIRAHAYIMRFLENVQPSLIASWVEGFSDENTMALCNKIFSPKTKAILEPLENE